MSLCSQHLSNEMIDRNIASYSDIYFKLFESASIPSLINSDFTHFTQIILKDSLGGKLATRTSRRIECLEIVPHEIFTKV